MPTTLERKAPCEWKPRQFMKFVVFGTAVWIPPMAGLALLSGHFAPAPIAMVVGMAGMVVVLAVSLKRSLSWPESVFEKNPSQTPHSMTATWSQVASLKANFASRWAMYEDLTARLGSLDWSGKLVGEIGGSNEALRQFLRGAQYRQLPYPDYDVQNLHQVSDSQFDVMVLDQTLEHVPDPERALREVCRTLKPGALAIITTPFLLPVHATTNYGDYYRWTPQGLEITLKRCGLEGEVRMWGSLQAVKALAEDMYLRADRARQMGLHLTAAESDATFPITVWVIAKNLKQASPAGAVAESTER